MADTSIDKLTLDIEVKDNTAGESSSKKVNNLASAVSRLDKIIKAFDVSNISNVFSNMTKSVSPFINQVKSAENGLVALSKMMGKLKSQKISDKVQEATGIKVEKTNVETQPQTPTAKLKESGAAQQIAELGKQSQMAKLQVDDLFGALDNDTERINLKISMLNNQLEEQKTLFAEIQRTGGDTSSVEKQIISTKEKVLSLNKQLEKLGKTSDKVKKPFRQIFRSFGRIAFYRAIRTVLREITQAFREGMAGLAGFSDEFKNNLSSLSTDIDKVKGAITVGLYQVVMSLTPEITNMANSIVDFANKLSLSMAIMKNSGSYIKVNTEYWKEYQDAVNGTLLSFDTFETLGKGGNTIDFSKMFEEVSLSDVAEKDKESVKGYISILESLKSVFSNIWSVLKDVFRIIKAIWDTGVSQTILGWVSSGIKFLDNVGLLKTALWGIVAVFTAIKLTQIGVWFSGIALKITNLKIGISGLTTTFGFLSLAIAGILAYDIISNWNEMTTFAKVLKLALIGVAAALFAVAVAGASMWSALTMGIAAAAIVSTIAVVVSQINAAKNETLAGIDNHAFGGGYSSADLFYANENGKTELVASNNNGGGAVMNLEQWGEISENAFYNAMLKYGVAQGNGAVTLTLDGSSVASSKRFVNEMNRRNKGLNLV